MTILKRFSGFFLAVLMVSALGCAATADRQSTSAYVDDAWITTKVKSDIFAEPSLKVAQVNVETYQGEVQLSGHYELGTYEQPMVWYVDGKVKTDFCFVVHAPFKLETDAAWSERNDTSLVLQPEIYATRKEREESKLDAMTDFVKSKECRSKLISAYFGSKGKACGVCDNCLTTEIKTDQLLQVIKDQLPASFNALTAEIPTSSDKLQEAVRKLMHDEAIYYEEGIYFLKEK